MTKNWKDIHLDFAYHGWDWETNYQQQWEKRGFTYYQTKEWINIGLKPTDANYAYWLTNIVELEPLTVLNEGDNQYLRAEYQEWLANKDVLNSLTPNNPTMAKANWPWKSIILFLIILTIIAYYLSQ
ncbi:MAG: hypothetical protein GBAus27B_000232 [Mycoplasmataceae bacterium]|nr:MAG: hypothetical protein GBAus27B_000232 [Mycoplasmataceae bacterium]